ncbi:MAG: hypothetical protein A2Z45_05920 [Chloroflexi bacterium RBG_19FT_COMBO_55_16]|nr:MAG: hypothetical protein A2Z45_05920 [Chloroflexi bacterium RBG_19FT_COMBO_55_16]
MLYQTQIRKATREDLPSLEWDGEFTHFRRLFAEAYRYTETGEALMWVAEQIDTGIIGQLFVLMESLNTTLADGHTRAYIYGFRVRPAYRGAGVGSRLLQTAETDLARRGFRLICLNVARVNQDARRLYERFGYRVVAAEAGIWSYLDEHGRRRQVNEPAWRMEKKL